MAKIIFDGKGKKEKRDYKAEFGTELKLLARRAGLAVLPEHKFLPTRNFTFDFAIKELKLAFEYEGGMFGVPGARRCRVCGELPKASHFAIDRIKRDAEKYNLAAIAGWRVIRILPTIGSAGKHIEFIEQAIAGARS